MKWTGRVVTDAGAISLDDESTTYDDLKDWLLDYYIVDDAEADVEIAAEYLYAAAYDEN